MGDVEIVRRFDRVAKESCILQALRCREVIHLMDLITKDGAQLGFGTLYKDILEPDFFTRPKVHHGKLPCLKPMRAAGKCIMVDVETQDV